MKSLIIALDPTCKQMKNTKKVTLAMQISNDFSSSFVLDILGSALS